MKHSEKLLLLTNIIQIAFQADCELDFRNRPILKESECSLPEKLKIEVSSFASAVQEIKNYVEFHKGRTWNDIANFVDTFGARPIGSDNLEKALNSLEKVMQKELSHVESHVVSNFSSWKGGFARAKLLEPVSQDLSVVPLLMSSPTPVEGIEAEVIDLRDNLSPKQVKGKVIHCAQACRHVASYAKMGALAALMRSSQTFSLYNLHHSHVILKDDGTSLPVLGITLEDSQLLNRLARKGHKVKVRIFSNCSLENNQSSRNLIGTYFGAKYPNETIQLGAHTDSVILGVGAQDDAVGVFLNLNALRILKALSIPPKRNIELAMWTAEEIGFIGATKFYEKYPNRLEGIMAALEADAGCIHPIGWAVGDLRKNKTFACVLMEIGKLIGPKYSSLKKNYISLNTNNDTDLKLSTDLRVLGMSGIPVGLLNSDSRYFWYHHSSADTPSALNSNEVDRCLVFLTGTAYVLANLEESF